LLWHVPELRTLPVCVLSDPPAARVCYPILLLVCAIRSSCCWCVLSDHPAARVCHLIVWCWCVLSDCSAAALCTGAGEVAAGCAL